jgi:hypothetical protein
MDECRYFFNLIRLVENKKEMEKDEEMKLDGDDPKGGDYS